MASSLRNASIRPRLFYRGKTSAAKADAPPGTLQFGRGCSTAERGGTDHVAAYVSRASIRPRLFYRGKAIGMQSTGRNADRFNSAAVVLPRKAARAVAHGPGRQASIRPRLFYRGKVTLAHLPRQWERGFNSAAVVLPRKGPGGTIRCPPQKLQFGRGCSTAESTTPFHALAQGHGFNSAAVVLPRKGSHAQTAVKQHEQASIRPRLFYRGKDL